MVLLNDIILYLLQVHRISQVDLDTEIVFNCQMGRGRTTTGMVIATLVYLNRKGASGNAFHFLSDSSAFLLHGHLSRSYDF